MSEQATKILGFILYLFVMALITYLLRLLPMLFIRRRITNRFIKSVLYYIPYSVLAVMTFPAIFYVTGNIITGIVATAVAIIAALFNRSLVTVAALSAGTILIMELLILPLII